MKKQIHVSMGEMALFDKESQMAYLTLSKGNFKVSFSYLDKLIKEYKGANRIYKPVYLLMYTDWKNNSPNDDKIIEIDNKAFEEIKNNKEFKEMN